MKSELKIVLFLLIVIVLGIAQKKITNNAGDIVIARLKYDGGGDWYADPSSLPNLIKFANANAPLHIAEEEKRVGIMDKDFFNYPYLYLTGHGNISFSYEEVKRLRQHLQNGGFLHVDDNYGLDKSFRREIKKVFPDNELVELPHNHRIFHLFFEFPDGLPKIHEHDNKPAQGFGIFHNGRLVVFYTYECDLGDGWEDPTVHNDTPAVRDAALKMGTNIILYNLLQ